MSDEASPPSAVVTTKRAERIAAEIEAEVLARGWPVGEFIASEPELVERFEVSRPTMREAVRILESQGVAVMRRGKKGGLVVARTDPMDAVRAVARQLQCDQIGESELFDARLALELRALELISKRLDAPTRDRLARIVGDDPSTPDVLPATEFHSALGELSGNRVLWLLTRILYSLAYQRFLAVDPEASIDPDVNLGREVHHAHRKIVEALVGGDLETAKRRLRIHLESTVPCSDGAAADSIP